MKELSLLFLKLGTTAFGGPAAHIAMMEDEVVTRKKWISREHFLDLVGITNLIPGPNSTEMAIHIGYLRGGWKGLIVAGVCFILPAVTITLVLAHLYTAYGTIPQLQPLIGGIRPAIIAIILTAVFRLSRPHVKQPFMVLMGLLVAALNLLGMDEILLLISAGIIGLLWSSRNRRQQLGTSVVGMLAVTGTPVAAMVVHLAGSDSATLTALGLFFLKIGSVLYGSGYVLVAFLQGGLVDTRQWLTQTRLLDAVAVGQFTPGPVLSTGTFIGYVILGIPGAAVATAGIFLPSFVFVLIISRFVSRLRQSSLASGFLDGVNAASLGLMLSVTIILAGSSLESPVAWIIFVLAAISVGMLNIHAAWIAGGAAIVGWLMSSYF
jgi:chromate transporter